MLWGYYISPMMYGQNAIVINEFLDERWSKVRYVSGTTIFDKLLRFFAYIYIYVCM